MKISLQLLPALMLSALPLVAGPATITREGADRAAAAVVAGQDQTPEAAKPAEPDELTARLKKAVDALGRLKISGYIQSQYVHDQSSADEISGASTKNRDQFSIRRGRVKFTYQAAPTARFVLQPDISSSVTLKDGYLELTEPWTPWKHTVTAGQFPWPFGFELVYSSSSREVPERSRAVNALFPGSRDRGVMFSGADPKRRFDYRLAIVNGTGTTQSFDFNKRKDVVGRLGTSLGKLDLGASVYRGAELVATAANAKGEEFDKQRAGLDVQWATPVPGLVVRGEYIRGRQAPPAGSSRGRSYEVEGWNAYLVQKAGSRNRFALRLDGYDPDTGAGGDSVRAATPAWLFQWDSHSLLMVAYERIDSGASDRDDDVFTVRLQFSF